LLSLERFLEVIMLDFLNFKKVVCTANLDAVLTISCSIIFMVKTIMVVECSLKFSIFSSSLCICSDWRYSRSMCCSNSIVTCRCSVVLWVTRFGCSPHRFWFFFCFIFLLNRVVVLFSYVSLSSRMVFLFGVMLMMILHLVEFIHSCYWWSIREKSLSLIITNCAIDTIRDFSIPFFFFQFLLKRNRLTFGILNLLFMWLLIMKWVIILRHIFHSFMRFHKFIDSANWNTIALVPCWSIIFVDKTIELIELSFPFCLFTSFLSRSINFGNSFSIVMQYIIIIDIILSIFGIMFLLDSHWMIIIIIFIC